MMPVYEEAQRLGIAIFFHGGRAGIEPESRTFHEVLRGDNLVYFRGELFAFLDAELQPALYAGQPLLVSTRIVKRGTTPVVIRGRLGDVDRDARGQQERKGYAKRAAGSDERRRMGERLA